MIALKVTVVLLCASAGALMLWRRSASLRHGVLAAGFGITCLLPLLEQAVPGWGLSVVPGVTRLAASSTVDGQWMRTLWYGGTVAGLASIGLGLVRIARLRALAQPIDARRRTLAEDAANELGIRRAVTVLETDRRMVPMTWGLLRPNILIPTAARQWSDDCLRSVLRHELAHVQRGDWAVQLAAALVARVFWFNPVVWLTARRLRREGERACDDVVLNLGVDRAEYASHLIQVARALNGRSAPPRLAPAAAVAGGFERRIAAALDPGIDRTPLSACACVLATIAIAGAAVPVAGFGQPAVDSTPLLLGVQRDVLWRFGGEERRFSILADDISFRKSRIEGRVELQGRLNVDGTLSGVRIVEPVHPDLASAAEVIVRHWRREPARVRGVPVEVPIRMTVDFRRE